MCRGSSTNFSMKTRSSPKALFASFRQEAKPSRHWTSSYATRNPFPPPPAEALIITG